MKPRCAEWLSFFHYYCSRVESPIFYQTFMFFVDNRPIIILIVIYSKYLGGKICFIMKIKVWAPD